MAELQTTGYSFKKSAPNIFGEVGWQASARAMSEYKYWMNLAIHLQTLKVRDRILANPATYAKELTEIPFTARKYFVHESSCIFLEKQGQLHWVNQSPDGKYLQVRLDGRKHRVHEVMKKTHHKDILFTFEDVYDHVSEVKYDNWLANFDIIDRETNITKSAEIRGMIKSTHGLELVRLLQFYCQGLTDEDWNNYSEELERLKPGLRRAHNLEVDYDSKKPLREIRFMRVRTSAKAIT